MNKKTFSYLLLLTLFTVACKQNDPQSTAPRIAITDQQLRDAATAKQGSYFIYQDSSNNTIDSFGVYISAPSYYRYASTGNVYHEIVSYTLKNDSTSGTGIYEPEIKFEAFYNAVTLSIQSHYLNSAGCAMTLPFMSGVSIAVDQTAGTGIAYIANFSEGGHSYGSTYEVIAHPRNYDNNTFIHSWFSLTKGLVKFSIYDGNTYFTYYQIKSNIIK